jgi:hypothetical protein
MNSRAYRSALVVAAGAVAAMATWSIARLAGVDFELKDSASIDEVAAFDVLFTTLIAGAAAWAVHEFLVSKQKQRWWPPIGSTALALSIAGPSWLADGETALVLIAMHVVVGFILIGGLGVFAARGQVCDPRQMPR